MSGVDTEDPRCPECGGPIGATATYCMHCSADLTAERSGVGLDADRQSEGGVGTGPAMGESPTGPQLLDPDGLVDDTLTVAVGIAGGLIAGILGTFVLLGLTESVWALPVGLIGWLVLTAYLVRHRTVQGAISHSAYAVAIALALFPLVAFGPSGGPDVSARVADGFVLMIVVALPAVVAAGIGYLAGRYVPDEN